MNGQSHASILFRRLLRERLRLCLFCFSVTFLAVFALTVAQNTCNMERNLGTLLAFAREFFETNQVTWWVDYGTLLGAIREHRILPFEFDLDLAIQDFDVPKLYAQREWVESRGFLLYKRLEFVPMKKKFYTKVWVALANLSILISLLIAAIHCFLSGFFADIADYGYYAAPNSSITPPKGYKPEDGPLLCNHEGFNGHNWPAGHCRRQKDIFPLTTSVLGPAPANSDRVLTEMYGNWRVPRPKGIKLMLCWMVPGDPSALLLMWLCVTALPLAVLLYPYQFFAERGVNGAVKESTV